MRNKQTPGKPLSSLLFALLVCQAPFFVLGQTTSEILENGIRIDKSNEMRFKFRIQDNTINYQAYDKKKTSYFPLGDSMFFLSDNQVLIYIVTLNPLNYSVTGQVKITDDALSKAEDDGLQSILGVLKKVAPLAAKSGGASGEILKSEFGKISGRLDNLRSTLKKDNKKTIAISFKKLKDINFDLQGEKGVEGIINQVATDTAKIHAIYKDLPSEVIDIQTAINAYTGQNDSPKHDIVLVKDYFSRQLADINKELQTQLVWVSNLDKSYSLVLSAFNTSIKEDGELFTAIAPTVTVDRGKIANLSLVVSQDGLKLSDDNDIVSADKKALVTKVVRFRRFQHFVFEMAAGTAFTFIEYPKFGTATDSATGKMVVSDAGKETFKRFNLTAMFNWNYYIPKSNIHPFIQLGVGANAEYPAFFLGGGLRFNTDKGSHFAIAGGFASSWVKTLNKLKIGDPVSGTAELEKDISYEFKWPVKPYIGIQYNF